MTTESSELQQIRNEIMELRLLYKKITESLIPVEEAYPEEVAALDEEPKEYISKEELLKLLKKEKRGTGPRRTKSA